jgi:hypothetical protein
VAISRASNSSIQGGLPKFNDIWDGTTATSAYDAISHVTLNSAQSTIVFNNIPATYTHLEIRSFAANSSSTGQYVKLILNSDSASGNYSEHHLAGNGTAASAGGNASFNNGGFFWAMGIPGTNNANVFGAGITSILDYANTNKYKTVRSFDGFDANGSGGINLVSNNWRSFSAITSITLSPNEGNNFRQYSSIALYGIK